MTEELATLVGANPSAVSARTVNVYGTPDDNPVTVIGAPVVLDAVNPPGLEVAVHVVVIPASLGVVNETVTLPVSVCSTDDMTDAAGRSALTMPAEKYAPSVISIFHIVFVPSCPSPCLILFVPSPS